MQLMSAVSLLSISEPNGGERKVGEASVQTVQSICKWLRELCTFSLPFVKSGHPAIIAACLGLFSMD